MRGRARASTSAFAASVATSNTPPDSRTSSSILVWRASSCSALASALAAPCACNGIKKGRSGESRPTRVRARQHAGMCHSLGADHCLARRTPAAHGGQGRKQRTRDTSSTGGGGPVGGASSIPVKHDKGGRFSAHVPHDRRDGCRRKG